jgi:hypothetical protein
VFENRWQCDNQEENLHVYTNCATKNGLLPLRLPRVIGTEGCAEIVISAVYVSLNINHVLELVYFYKCS